MRKIIIISKDGALVLVCAEDLTAALEVRTRVFDTSQKTQGVIPISLRLDLPLLIVKKDGLYDKEVIKGV